jgi:hypothetical protein
LTNGYPNKNKKNNNNNNNNKVKSKPLELRSRVIKNTTAAVLIFRRRVYNSIRSTENCDTYI